MHGRGLDLLERAEGADAAVVDEDQLARLDVAQEARADDVERDAFREAKIVASPSLPMTSGRMPSGSRQAIRPSSVSTTSE